MDASGPPGRSNFPPPLNGFKTPFCGLVCQRRSQVFRELVWQRSQADVRNALGPPELVTEDPAGVHWRYGYEVARAEKIFPAVTLVFRNDVVSSYYFELAPESSADQ